MTTPDYREITGRDLGPLRSTPAIATTDHAQVAGPQCVGCGGPRWCGDPGDTCVQCRHGDVAVRDIDDDANMGVSPAHCEFCGRALLGQDDCDCEHAQRNQPTPEG